MKKSLILLLILIALSSIAETLSVRDIQFSSSGPSPLNGQVVTVAGIITATDYSGDKYYLGDRGGGPWSGVYVYDYSHPVSVGEFVTLTATVDEYYGLTELKTVTALSVDSTGAIPEPWPTNCGTADTSESLEGVLVEIANVYVVGGVDSLWEISDATGSLKVKKGFSYTNRPSAGDTLEMIRGMISYSWNEFVLEPRFNADIVSAGDTTPPPDTVFTPIADIQANPAGFDEVIVQGVITAPAGALKDNQLKAYIQDSSGKGIQIFEWSLTAEMESLLVRGAVARVSGAVTEYLGTTEIEVDDWAVVGSDTMPAPLEFSSVSANPIPWEGTWMKARGTVTDRYSTGDGNWNVEIDVGGTELLARIWSTTGINGDEIAVGDDITISGIGGVFNSAFQLLPAMPEDILTVPFTVNPSGEAAELILPEGVFVPSADELMNIGFTVPSGKRAVLRLFDRMGRNVATLYDAVPSAAMSLSWNGRDETSQFVREGIYLLQLESIGVSGERETVRKTLVIGSFLK